MTPLRGAGLAFIAVICAPNDERTASTEPQEVERLLDEARAQFQRTRFAEARGRAERALQRSEELRDPGLEARSRHVLAEIEDQQGAHVEAAAHHDRAIRLARESRDRQLEAQCLLSKGYGLTMQRRHVEARELYEAALGAQREVGDERGQATTHKNLGISWRKEGKPREAIEALEKAEAICRKSGFLAEQVDVLGNMSRVLMDVGEYARAIEQSDEALRILGDSEDSRSRSDVLRLLGQCYLAQGDRGEAQKYFEQALELARSAGAPLAICSALNRLGQTHADTGRFEAAVQCYREACALAETNGDEDTRAWNLCGLGAVFLSQGDAAAALQSYEQARRIWTALGRLSPLAGVLQDIGQAHEKAGDLDAALAAYGESLEAGERVSYDYQSLSLSRTGVILSSQGDRERAIDFANRAVAHAREVEKPELVFQALGTLAGIERRLGQKESALRHLLESLEVVEKLRTHVVPRDESRTAFLEEKQGAYAAAIQLLLEAGRSEDALRTAEAARARAFLDLLGSRQIHAFTSIPVASLDDLRQVAIRLRSTIVEYFFAEDRLSIWVIQPGGEIRWAASASSAGDVARWARELADGFSSRRDRSDAEPLLRKLHDALIVPIAAWLPGDPAQLVTIVPHGALFDISYASLLDAAGGYFLESHTLHYAPAISVLRFTGRRSGERVEGGARRMLCIGDPVMPSSPRGAAALRPLAGAAREVASISSLLPADETVLLTGSDAHEQAFRDAAPGATLIHIASHAVLAGDSVSGFIALAPSTGSGSEADGLLVTDEVFQLRLKADLVVLSACDSGRGRILGEGVMGWGRAFLAAGASSIVVSLWPVLDLAGEAQMTGFYRQLLTSGKTKAAALREAQLETLAALRAGRLRTPSGRPLRISPIHWASFALLGEPR